MGDGEGAAHHFRRAALGLAQRRPLGVLDMHDEAGGDQKLLAVPIDKILPWYKHWRSPDDIAPERLARIRHFFEHYKDLESGKWVRIVGWKGPERARELLIEAVASYQTAKDKPAF